MAILRLQCDWQLDTAFPRDRVSINPHFSVSIPGGDEDGLCEDLIDALQTWKNVTGQVRVTSYDAQGTAPVFPNGQAIRNVGTVMTQNYPRELAICLSYFSTNNVPRRRGRLYIPAPLLPAGDAGIRPTNAQQVKVGDLASIFANLGGSDVDWCVYSRVNDEAYSVSNWWVDDEWDAMRSRGLRSTSRITGTLSE